MKSQGRREEDKAKQACFIAALNFIFATTEYNKVTKVLRLLVDEKDKEDWKKMKNLFYSVKNGRSTPPDYIAQQLFDAAPSDELYDMLSQQFPVEREPAEPVEPETPLEDELPEMLLGRIRELKLEMDKNQETIKALENERKKIMAELQDVVENPKNEKDTRLARLLSALRESNLVLI